MLSLLKTRVRNTQISSVEILFILLLLAFGVPMVILIPPGAGYDEEDHLVRVWELSAFAFIPGQMPPQVMKYPTVFRDFAYRQQGSSGIIGSEFWQEYAHASLYEHGFVRRELDTKSVYSPPLLFPQAIAMRILGRSANLPTLTVFYACRFANLLSYLILIWLAIRWMPFGKWIVLVLALAPTALFQATTISPDAISNGIGFLFIVGCLRLAGLEEIGWKEVGLLIVLSFLLFLAKLNLLPLILLPFLIIPPSKFTNKGIYAFLLAVTLILFLVAVVGWNGIALSKSDPLMANEANPRGQLFYIASHPFVFLITLINDLLRNGFGYLLSWINGYGYYYWTPPQLVSLFFLLSLGFVLLMDSTSERVTKKFRVAFILVFVAGFLVTVLSVYTTFTPVGSDQIFGVQGRYFIPSALLLFLTFSGSSWIRKLTIQSSRWMIICLSIALSLNVLGILFAFHVPCGTTYYEAELCYRPLFKNLSTEVRPSPSISKQVSITQEFQVSCDGLAELRVWLVPSVPVDQGATRFVLQDPRSDQTLFDKSIANNQISTEDWYPLRFDPVWRSAGNQYLLNVTGTNASPEQGLKLLYTIQSEFDLGKLHENGQLMTEDVVLQYGCVTGLQKIWLTGKP